MLGEERCIMQFRWLGLAPLCICLCALPGYAQNPAVTVSVDVQANRHAISPLIYGVNLFEDPNTTTILQDLNAPINRYGGNRASTYNWNLNSDNRGNDNFFESISDDGNNPAVPGGRGDIFITQTKAASAEPMVSIPILDYIGQAGPANPFPCSYPIAKYPMQYAFDPFEPVCGDGLMPNGITLIDANPADALTPNSLATQQAWVQHMITANNNAANGGLKYYILDNEHDLWWQTHHDAVPQAPHYNQELDRMVQYAAMIKAQDLNALVAGPETSGWLGYELSPADFEYGQLNGYANYPNFPDHTVINQEYVPWLLGQFQQYDTNNHQRILDVLTLHYYPQGGANNQNTRSLWDPNYVDPSYINDKIMLVPRMKQWVAGNYPGTKIGITEYNWSSCLNDETQCDSTTLAVTQADVLGIFGREGLDLATRFNAPVPNYPSYYAMKMYRNYDGGKSTFGDVSVQASSVENPDNVVAFASQRTSDGSVTVMLLSKYAANNTPATLSIANAMLGASAHVWQLSASFMSGKGIQQLPDLPVNAGSLSLSLPPESITLLVIPTGDFGITAPTPGAVMVGQGNLTQSISFSSTATGGFAGTVTFGCTGLPVGASCGFTPPTATPAANNPVPVSLVINSGAVATGSYPVTITATVNGTVRSQPLALTIGPAATPADLVLQATPKLNSPTLLSAAPVSLSFVVTNNTAGSSVQAVLSVNFQVAAQAGTLPAHCLASGLSVTCNFTSTNGAQPMQFDVPVNAPFAARLAFSAVVTSNAPAIDPKHGLANGTASLPPRPFFRVPPPRYP